MKYNYTLGYNMISCIAVDDEPLALEIIEEYAIKTDKIDLVSKFTSPLEAMGYLNENKPDIIFLDIEMPDISGFELLDSLNYKPAVIITSAYEDYALKSYNFDAVDYLMKPFPFSRFIRAINKASSFIDSIKKKNDDKESFSKIKQTANEFIFVNEGGRITKLKTQDIDFIKGMSDYITIHTEKCKYIVRENLKSLENSLLPKVFIRVHKSYLVPASSIDYIKGNSVFVGKNEIPIGRTYKPKLIEQIESYRIG